MTDKGPATGMQGTRSNAVTQLNTAVMRLMAGGLTREHALETILDNVTDALALLVSAGVGGTANLTAMATAARWQLMAETERLQREKMSQSG